MQLFRSWYRVLGITYSGKSQERAAFKVWLVLNREFELQLLEIKAIVENG